MCIHTISCRYVTGIGVWQVRRCSTFSVSPAERPRVVAQPLVGLCGLVCSLAAPKDLPWERRIWAVDFGMMMMMMVMMMMMIMMMMMMQCSTESPDLKPDMTICV